MVGIFIIGMKVISIVKVKGKYSPVSVPVLYTKRFCCNHNERVQVQFPKNQQLRIQ